MSEFQKEKYTGTWNGREVSFNRSWGGHRFTDVECRDLCAGEEITIEAVNKEGRPYKVMGRLANLEYNGRPYVGFERTGFPPADVPDEWCQHKFTEEEKILLRDGRAVQLEGCVSAKGNTFSCKVTFGENENGRMAIIPDFSK